MEGNRIIKRKINIQALMGLGFLLTVPSLVFWIFVLYSRLFHSHTYANVLLDRGGIFLNVLVKGILPFASLIISVICNRILREQARDQKVMHRETTMMRINQRLINWNAILILAMLLSLMNH